MSPLENIPTASPTVNWNELDQNGKIERMRIIIKSQQDEVAYLRTKLWTLTTQLLNHSHVDHQVMVPASSIGDVDARLSRNEDYF